MSRFPERLATPLGGANSIRASRNSSEGESKLPARRTLLALIRDVPTFVATRLKAACGYRFVPGLRPICPWTDPDNGSHGCWAKFAEMFRMAGGAFAGRGNVRLVASVAWIPGSDTFSVLTIA